MFLFVKKLFQTNQGIFIEVNANRGAFTTTKDKKRLKKLKYYKDEGRWRYKDIYQRKILENSGN